MPRLIDADVMRQDWLENGENEYVYDTNAVLDSIDSQPTVNRWIPVTERLPGMNEKVLFITKTYTIYCGWYTVSHGTSYNKGFETESGFVWLGNVHHWMPLPEPPKEDIK